jgi:hypothetical protein
MLRAYQRRTLAADALIASCYLAGTNTRRVRRALASLFAGAVGKDTVSRVWRKLKSDWDAWNARSLAEEPIVRLILDDTVLRVRLDRNPPPGTAPNVRRELPPVFRCFDKSYNSLRWPIVDRAIVRFRKIVCPHARVVVRLPWREQQGIHVVRNLCDVARVKCC